jgi:hypothetical protein
MIFQPIHQYSINLIHIKSKIEYKIYKKATNQLKSIINNNVKEVVSNRVFPLWYIVDDSLFYYSNYSTKLLKDLEVAWKLL